LSDEQKKDAASIKVVELEKVEGLVKDVKNVQVEFNDKKAQLDQLVASYNARLTEFEKSNHTLNEKLEESGKRIADLQDALTKAQTEFKEKNKEYPTVNEGDSTIENIMGKSVYSTYEKVMQAKPIATANHSMVNSLKHCTN